MAIHCPECGFVNPEGANYCQKCGAYLARPEGADEPTTMTYKVDETGDFQPVDIDAEVDRTGAALVIRSGGGRAGESFPITGDRISIGRTPDAGVFLDDAAVTLDGVTTEETSFETDLGGWAVTDPPEGTSASVNNWTRTDQVFEEGAGITTRNTVYLGFGAESLVDQATRTDLVKRSMAHLLHGRR